MLPAIKYLSSSKAATSVEVGGVWSHSPSSFEPYSGFEVDGTAFDDAGSKPSRVSSDSAFAFSLT